MSDLKIAVMGAAGRMGQAICHAILEQSGCTISGGTEVAGSEAVGKDIGLLIGKEELGVKISDDTAAVIAEADAIIDFTAPAATIAFAKMAAESNTIHIIGTTGMTADDEAQLREPGEKTTIVKAGNMSLGVNLLTAITRKVAEALDADFDIEVVEMHHKHKVDAPSGTALMLGQAAAEGRGIKLEEKSVRSRDGITGARNREDIGFATLRGGSVIGDHTVIFAGEGERIEITHKAQDRTIFARGAVKAALWARGKSPGVYSMTDVLGI